MTYDPCMGLRELSGARTGTLTPRLATVLMTTLCLSILVACGGTQTASPTVTSTSSATR